MRQSGLFKPSTYVEISVDDNSPRKTDISKNTTHPKWKEEVTVLVKPHTKILFRVIDHHNFRKDNVIGEKKLNLFQILKHFNGKCENLELTLGKIFSSFHHSDTLTPKSYLFFFVDLMSTRPISESNGVQETKNGELVVILNGLNVDITAEGVNAAAAHNNSETPNHSNVLNGGVRARLRTRGTENSIRGLPKPHHQVTSLLFLYERNNHISCYFFIFT